MLIENRENQVVIDQQLQKAIVLRTETDQRTFLEQNY